MKGKARPDRAFVSKLYIYHNNENMITSIAVRPNIDNNFISDEYNGVHWDYVTEKCMLDESQLF
jgi:hypothetical protein